MTIPTHLRTGPAAGPPVGLGRVFSTWDWSRCEYDYWYDPTAPSDAGGWLARPVAADTKPWSPYGDPIENLLAELPPTAIPIGRGRQAWGEIVVRNRADALAMRNLSLGEGTPGYKPIMDSGIGSADSRRAGGSALLMALVIMSWIAHKVMGA